MDYYTPPAVHKHEMKMQEIDDQIKKLHDRMIEIESLDDDTYDIEYVEIESQIKNLNDKMDDLYCDR